MEPTQIAFTFPVAEEPNVRLGVTVPIDTSFPEEEANTLAQIESFNKHLFRPNTYLHKWWARRSGTTFRHILKQLVPDPSRRDYYPPGGLEGATILDPMMGGCRQEHLFTVSPREGNFTSWLRDPESLSTVPQRCYF